MNKFVKVDNRVQHPDKVRDVSWLLCKFSLLSRGPYTPFVVVVGIGPHEAEYRGHSAKREMHNIIQYFKLKGLPLSNIIGVDLDVDICEQWLDEDITIVNGNWNDPCTFFEVRDRIRILSREQRKQNKTIVYANTRGCHDDVACYPKITNILSPHYMISLYTKRVKTIPELIINHKGYEGVDLGIMQNSRKYDISGLMVYRGIFSHAIRKK